jgi:hypothetical protein
MATFVADQLGLDPTLPNVTLVIGGAERKLCFDFNAIVLAEKETGLNLLQAVVNDPSATNLRGLLFAALVRDQPTVTPDEVGKWITMRNIGTIRQALLAAWFGSIDEAAEKDEAPGEATAQAQTNA